MKGLFLKIRDKLFLNSVRSAFRDESALLRSEIAKRIDDASAKQSQALDLVSARQDEIQAGLAQLAEKVSTLEKKLFISEVQRHYQDVRKEIAERIKTGEKLRFASYVVYDTTFGAHGICELMLKEPEKYDVTFVVCPDTYRDMDGLKLYHKTKQFFVERYGADRVLDGYDETTGEFLDHSDKFDVVYLANPYDCLVNRVHGVQYLSNKNLLPIFICYGFIISNLLMKVLFESQYSALFYKFFVDAKQTKVEAVDFQKFYTRNIVLSGYPKMDKLVKIPEINHSRKKILIAPHHTVKGLSGDLQLSNFLEYADFILKLVDLFPNVDFVFRPHPLLFTNLAMNGIWSKEEIDSYLDSVKRKNIAYSTESDYLHLFKDCDAIIHDCGSYMVEWLYTGKPCCYVVDSEERVRAQLNRLSNFALDCHTQIADSREKIIAFIKKVESDEYPVNINERVKNEIMVNYPNCSDFILKNLLKL